MNSDDSRRPDRCSPRRASANISTKALDGLAGIEARQHNRLRRANRCSSVRCDFSSCSTMPRLWTYSATIIASCTRAIGASAASALIISGMRPLAAAHRQPGFRCILIRNAECQIYRGQDRRHDHHHDETGDDGRPANSAPNDGATALPTARRAAIRAPCAMPRARPARPWRRGRGGVSVTGRTRAHIVGRRLAHGIGIPPRSITCSTAYRPRSHRSTSGKYISLPWASTRPRSQ